MKHNIAHPGVSGPGLLLAVLLLIPPTCLYAQADDPLRPPQDTGTKKMTTAEIDAKLNELGLTRQEALRKAQDLGVPIEQYLQAIPDIHGQRVERGDTSVLARKRSSPAKEASGDIREEEKAGPVEQQPIPLGPGGLPYYGYDIFRELPKAFEPSASGPVDPEYLIGAEDVLKVSVWGQAEFQYELTVDREGRIFIPTVGQMLVSGMTLRDASDKLRRQMSRSYSGLVSQPPTVWLDVTIARLRPKRVFLMGEIRRPGGYTLSSYATVFNSLYSVGGPTVNGSLRDIRVLRGNTVIAHVDLYDYLSGADRTTDIRVQNNDIIFVPVRGKTVSIRGEVRRPAVYELREGENFSALLRMCGGVLATAYDVTAQIDRIKPIGTRSGGVEDRLVVDVPLRDILAASNGRDAELFEGDEVRIFEVLNEQRNFVSIEGSVWRPGRYELGNVKSVRDLLRAAEGIQPRTYLGFAHITRLNADLITRRIMSFNLELLLNGAAGDIELMPRDRVYIYSTEIIEVKDRFVTIGGSVKRPGRYALSTDMTLKDLIPLAGGYTEEAELLEAEVSRVKSSGLRGDTLAIILHPKLPTEFSPDGAGHPEDTAAAAYTASEEFLLQHRDEVLVKPNPYYVTQHNVQVRGDIKYPGAYSIQRRGERLSEILDRAGGPTVTSYMGGARFYRNGDRLLLDFQEAYQKNNVLHDVVMLAGDSIFIPSKPHTVLVTGQVNNPGLLSFIEGDDVTDYIDRAGGLTDSSNYAVLVKPSGESRRVNLGWFSSDPEVPEGSSIEVLKINPQPPENKSVDISGTIKDVLAILTSAGTLAFIVWQVSK